ncbi:MAG: hypothetical protein ACO3N7_08075 [Kiritimatiellia bacterium]
MMKTPEQLKLQRWLEEYALDRVLQTGLSGKLEASCPDFSQEPAPAEGQIRLWPAREREMSPCYGVLFSAGYSKWRVFPFSEFSMPATPEEWKLRDGGPARVLQGWNVRVIDQAAARQSWCVDCISDAEMFGVNRWWLEISAGELRCGEQQGPPLRHPLDPRYEYLDAEGFRVDACIGEARPGYPAAPELKKAAEPPESYGGNSEKDPSP